MSFCWLAGHIIRKFNQRDITKHTELRPRARLSGRPPPGPSAQIAPSELAKTIQSVLFRTLTPRNLAIWSDL